MRRCQRLSWMLALIVGLSFGSSGCLRFGWNRLSTKVPGPVLDMITVEGIAVDTRALEGEGHALRTPFSEDERRTLRYLTRRFKTIGLDPAGDDGKYLQEVPVVAARVQSAQLRVGTTILRQGEDLILWARGDTATIQLRQADLVFVGHGVAAPERRRNDYQDLDLEGKVALVLAGSGFEQERQYDWYSHWQYKVAEAARRGALGVLLIHDKTHCGSEWPQWRESFAGFKLFRREDTQPHCEFEAWISRSAGDLILKEAGVEADRARLAARSPGFRGRHLQLKVDAEIELELRSTRSYNVVGEIPGRYDAEQSILICAPWDGGEANASATAGLLALATAFSSLAERPARSIVFVASTLSTRGNLGAEESAHRPPRGLDECAAALVLDGRWAAPVLADTLAVGGTCDNELGHILSEAAQLDELGAREWDDDGEWFRSCALAFARQGVPAVVLGTSVSDLRMALRAGFRMAQIRGGPRWNPDSAFRFFPRSKEKEGGP